MNDSSHYELYEWYIRNTWEILLNAYDILLFRSARLFTVGCPKDRLLCEDVSYLSPPRGGRGKPHFPNGIPFGMETTKNWSASSPKTVQMMPMIVFPGCCELLHRHLTDHLPRELTVGDPSPLWTTTHERSWNTSMFPVALLIQERDRSHWFKNTMVFKKPDVLLQTHLSASVCSEHSGHSTCLQRQDLRCARRYLQPGKQWFCEETLRPGPLDLKWFKGLRLTAGRRPSNDVWLKCFWHTFSPLMTEAKAYEPKTSAATRRYGSDVPRPAADEVFPTSGNIWELGTSRCCLSFRPNVIR